MIQTTKRAQLVSSDAFLCPTCVRYPCEVSGLDCFESCETEILHAPAGVRNSFSREIAAEALLIFRVVGIFSGVPNEIFKIGKYWTDCGPVELTAFIAL